MNHLVCLTSLNATKLGSGPRRKEGWGWAAVYLFILLGAVAIGAAVSAWNWLKDAPPAQKQEKTGNSKFYQWAAAILGALAAFEILIGGAPPTNLRIMLLWLAVLAVGLAIYWLTAFAIWIARMIKAEPAQERIRLVLAAIAGLFGAGVAPGSQLPKEGDE